MMRRVKKYDVAIIMKSVIQMKKISPIYNLIFGLCRLQICTLNINGYFHVATMNCEHVTMNMYSNMNNLKTRKLNYAAL